MTEKSENLILGILAHVDAGKTTMAEGLLYYSGTIRKPGRVDHKDTYLDTFEMERARGITIFSKQARFTWKNQRYTLLDTPGHVDFSAEMERTLQVLDYAILVISAPDGVQGHDITLWNLLRQYRIPVFLFVMYLVNRGTTFTQALFINCDHSMLTYAFYKKPGTILKLFWIRLRELVKINLLSAWALKRRKYPYGCFHDIPWGSCVPAF